MKKATVKTLMGWILFSIVFVLLVWLGVMIGEIITYKNTVEMCHVSVLVRAGTKTAGRANIPLDCPREYVKFYNDHVEIDKKTIAVKIDKGDDKYEYKKKFKSLTPDIVKETMAHQLENCFYKMGQAKVNPFHQEIMVAGYDSVCVVCSDISFDASAKIGDVVGFEEYLKTHNARFADTDYYTYLTSPETEQVVIPFWLETAEGEEPQVVDKINTNKNYYIVFLSYNTPWTHDIGEFLKKHGLPIAPAGLYNAAMFIVPTDGFKDIKCERLEN